MIEGGKMKSIVGISCPVVNASYGNWERRSALLPIDYIEIVEAAGGVPVIIPPTESSEEIVERIDALIISGGPDLDPSSYGHKENGSIDYSLEQDDSEFRIVKEAINRDMPILGICRGMQLMSVLHGGFMHQHLDSTADFKEHGKYWGEFSEHKVCVEKNSLLENLMGKMINVNSYHHQGLANAGSLSITGYSEHDNLIEAVERPDLKFFLGVQWHPERIEHLALFTALVEAARS